MERFLLLNLVMRWRRQIFVLEVVIFSLLICSFAFTSEPTWTYAKQGFPVPNGIGFGFRNNRWYISQVGQETLISNEYKSSSCVYLMGLLEATGFQHRTSSGGTVVLRFTEGPLTDPFHIGIRPTFFLAPNGSLGYRVRENHLASAIPQSERDLEEYLNNIDPSPYNSVRFYTGSSGLPINGPLRNPQLLPGYPSHAFHVSNIDRAMEQTAQDFPLRGFTLLHRFVTPQNQTILPRPGRLLYEPAFLGLSRTVNLPLNWGHDVESREPERPFIIANVLVPPGTRYLDMRMGLWLSRDRFAENEILVDRGQFIFVVDEQFTAYGGRRRFQSWRIVPSEKIGNEVHVYMSSDSGMDLNYARHMVVHYFYSDILNNSQYRRQFTSQGISRIQMYYNGEPIQSIDLGRLNTGLLDSLSGALPTAH